MIANQTATVDPRLAASPSSTPSPNPTIALQGSGTADAPYVAFHLDLDGPDHVSFAFTARDIDGSADDASQQVALQYRIGASGAFTNLADGYIADATTGGTATQTTTRTSPCLRA